ncbi:hypothetical protein LEMLEM_LOCUS25051, partial [Lemmus lemmus]
VPFPWTPVSCTASYSRRALKASAYRKSCLTLLSHLLLSASSQPCYNKLHFSVLVRFCQT